MKIVRGNDHDLEQMKEIKKHQPIDLDILVDRFRNVMKHVIGNQRTIRLNFLAMVAEIFSEKKANQLENEL